MAIIRLETKIAAPPDRVFDLARNIDAHQDSTTGTSEKAVGGVATGLIGAGGEVTWEAQHFGFRQRLTVRITQFERPRHFQDVMVKGAFTRMIHDHYFAASKGGTLMADRFEFVAPLGPIGWIAEWLFLTGYLRSFTVRRNAILKQTAETDGWRKYLTAG